ncbi:hypothetical protein VPH35_007042 [Triticum aestivum]
MVKGRRSRRRRCSAANLTDDLVVEILSRLPARSACRFKCVSTTWRDLISHPVHRVKLPQTLDGFFTKHDSETVLWSVPHFTNVSGTGLPLVSPLLDFLPIHKRIFLLDSCNGLLLCSCCAAGELDMIYYHQFVCNPATKEWVALPDHNQAEKWRCSCLGFNPAVAPHFYVFEFFKDYGPLTPSVVGVEVYSSETGGRVRKEHELDSDFSLPDRLPGVFFNGYLHYLTHKPSIAVVDTEGNAHRNIPVPVPGEQWFGFIQLSQGRLHYANFEADHEDEVVRLVVYVLEDYDKQEWTLKHTAEASYVVGSQKFEWVAIHPDCNMIFYTVEWDKTLMSYDMDRRQVQEICTLGEDTRESYLPYVPLFSELQALHPFPS